MPGEAVDIHIPNTSPVPQNFHCHGIRILTVSPVVGFVYPPVGPGHPGNTIAPLPPFDWSVEFLNCPPGPNMRVEVETVNPPFVQDSVEVEIVPGLPSPASYMLASAQEPQNGSLPPVLVIERPKPGVTLVPPQFTARGRVENANRGGIRGLVIRPGAPPTAVLGTPTLNGKEWTVTFTDLPLGAGQILRVRTADGRAFAEIVIDVVAGAPDP